MLLLRKENEAVWVQTNYRGKAIELEIMPANPEHFDKIKKKHTRYDFVTNPETKKMEKVATVDNEAVANDMADYLLNDFRGIGYSENEPLPVTRENKIMVAFMAPTRADKETLWEFITRTANELRTRDDDETESRIKN